MIFLKERYHSHPDDRTETQRLMEIFLDEYPGVLTVHAATHVTLAIAFNCVSDKYGDKKSARCLDKIMRNCIVCLFCPAGKQHLLKRQIELPTTSDLLILNNEHNAVNEIRLVCSI